jgi:hypothetical protein
MKIKLIILFILVVIISSCRKEITAFRSSPLEKGNPVFVETKQASELNVPMGTAMGAEEKPDGITTQSRKKNNLEKSPTKKLNSKKSLLSPMKKEITKRERARKEMNPRLSRALWMTIPGGLAVVLGILLYGVAPTGLFIFAFSIVFLVGLVSLIIYLANPKPKM